MPKRSYSEHAEPEEIATQDPAAAIALLSQHASEILRCVEQLRASPEAAVPALTELSRATLPAWQALSRGNSGSSEARQDEPSAKRQKVACLTAWTPSDIVSQLPALPQVLDADLERAAFTHLGATSRLGDLNYETLEWVGDAYLYIISTGFLFQTFPNLQHGKLAQLREILVKNSTLSGYSYKYGFEKRANLPSEFDSSGREGGTEASLKQRSKIYGDIFEAYVAAVILSDPVDGLSRTADWLKALWTTTISKDILRRAGEARNFTIGLPNMGSAADMIKAPNGPASQTIVHQPPKVRLAAELSVKGIQLRYADIESNKPPKKDPQTGMRLFDQGVYLTGWGETNKLLGRGTAQSKKEAQSKAAQMVLENDKIMHMYREKKERFMRSQAEQESAAKALEDSLM